MEHEQAATCLVDTLVDVPSIGALAEQLDPSELCVALHAQGNVCRDDHAQASDVDTRRHIGLARWKTDIAEIDGHVPDADLPVAVEAFRATVEGTFLKGLDKRARRRVLRFALERLMTG